MMAVARNVSEKAMPALTSTDFRDDVTEEVTCVFSVFPIHIPLSKNVSNANYSIAVRAAQPGAAHDRSSVASVERGSFACRFHTNLA
jgi:hypothetical protein